MPSPIVIQRHTKLAVKNTKKGRFESQHYNYFKQTIGQLQYIRTAKDVYTVRTVFLVRHHPCLLPACFILQEQRVPSSYFPEREVQHVSLVGVSLQDRDGGRVC